MVSRILLADDSITIQKVINLTFADEGIEVISVSNGDAAQRRLPEVDPDLVLADIFMPGKNGYELCEAIKTDPKYGSLPVVLLVGAFEPFNEAEAKRVKADGHLTKPFESRVLVDLVRKLIASHPRKKGSTAPLSKTASPEPEPMPPGAQNFSPILRPEASLDFTAMSGQVSAPPVPDPPVYFPELGDAPPATLEQQQREFFQTTPMNESDAATQKFSDEEEFPPASTHNPESVMGPRDTTSGFEPPAIVIAEVQTQQFGSVYDSLDESYLKPKPARPRQDEPQGVWTLDSKAPDAVVDFEKVDAEKSRLEGDLVAFEVDAVSTSVATEEQASTASQQAFITILTKPVPQEADVEEEEKPQKFDTSELMAPAEAPAVKKFDTNELAPPVNLADTPPKTEEPQLAGAPAELISTSFGFDGDSEEEPLGDVLMDTLSLTDYSSSAEQSPLEIEEPVMARPPANLADETQVAGSPVSVDAFVDVTAQPTAAMPMPVSTQEGTRDFAFAETPIHEEEKDWSETNFDLLTAPSGGETIAESTPQGLDAQFSSADMWSIGVPAEAPEADSAPVTPETPVTVSRDASTPAMQGVEMSSKLLNEIVRRVVAQLSDTVVREIAWEVVPDCVERIVTNLTKEKLAEKN